MQNTGIMAWVCAPPHGLQHVSHVFSVIGLLRKETVLCVFATCVVGTQLSLRMPPHIAASLRSRCMFVDSASIASRHRWAPQKSEHTEKK